MSTDFESLSFCKDSYVVEPSLGKRDKINVGNPEREALHPNSECKDKMYGKWAAIAWISAYLPESVSLSMLRVKVKEFFKES